MKKVDFRRLNWFLLILSVGLSLWAYNKLPDQVASHWNIRGVADSHVGRFWGAFLLPIVSLGAYLMFLWLPRLDPRRANIALFRPAFERFIFVILVFFLYIYSLTLWWNIIGPFDMNRLMVAGIAIVFWEAGSLVARSKPNWFIGIRTPWTLSSDSVWKRTHELGSKLFKSAAIVCLLAIVWPQQLIWFLAIPVAIAVIVTILFSYFAYRQETTKASRKT